MSAAPFWRKWLGRSRREPERRSSAGPTVGALLDHIAPDGLLEMADQLQLGPGQHIRVHAVTQYPGMVHVGWLDGLYGAADIDVAVWLFPEEPAGIVPRLTRRITGLQAQLELDYRRGDISRRHLLERDITEADTLRARVQWGEDRVFSAAVLFVVAAPTIDELDRRCTLLERELLGCGAEARSLFLRQAPGLVTSSPAGAWDLGNDGVRLLNLGAAAGFYPLAAADMAHPGGVLIGTNRITGGPVILNSFAGPAAGLTNPHVGVFAQSGSGKTVLLKAYAARKAVAGTPVVILDPEREYAPAVAKLGGHVLRLEAGRPAGINPLDLEVESADAETSGTVNLQDKVSDVRALVAHMLALHRGDMTPEESALLDRVVFRLYAARGITPRGESLYEEYGMLDGEVYRAGRRRKPMPRLRDLHAAISAEPGLQRLGLLLEPYLEAGSMGLFDGETTVGLGDAHLICFDLFGLDERYVRPLAMHVALGWILEKFVKQRRGVQKLVVADEAWMLLQRPDTAAFLEDLARRARKRLCGLVLASQSFAEFRDTEQGRAVLNNLGTRVIMSQKPEQLADAAAVFQLTEGERAAVARFGRGDALIKTSTQSVWTLVEVTPEEMELLAIPRGD